VQQMGFSLLQGGGEDKYLKAAAARRLRSDCKHTCSRDRDRVLHQSCMCKGERHYLVFALKVATRMSAMGVCTSSKLKSACHSQISM
jgi:hypothetical protein